MSTLTHELLAIRRRYLHELEKQQATLGVLAPPHIALDMAQARTEIERLLHYSYIFTVQREQRDEERPQLMPGLVALVSPEAVPGGASTLTQAAFHAIDYHRAALRHCWLIASAGDRGSLVAATWLAAYCTQRGITAHVWHVQDAAQIDETLALVRWIYAVAVADAALLPRDVVADLTGGTKPMSIGVWLACQGQAPMQYMVRQPDGISVPLLLAASDTGAPEAHV